MKHFVGFIFLFSSSVAFSQEIGKHVVNTPTFSVSKPLIVVDGKLLPRLAKSKDDSTKWVSPLLNIDPSEINEIRVLKNDSAVMAYGEAARDGALIISIKKHKKKTLIE